MHNSVSSARRAAAAWREFSSLSSEHPCYHCMTIQYWASRGHVRHGKSHPSLSSLRAPSTQGWFSRCRSTERPWTRHLVGWRVEGGRGQVSSAVEARPSAPARPHPQRAGLRTATRTRPEQGIARVARKEIRAETNGLKKAVTGYRHDIATLKKRLQDLERQLKAGRAPPQTEDQGADEEGASSCVSAPNVSPHSAKSLVFQQRAWPHCSACLL